MYLVEFYGISYDISVFQANAGRLFESTVDFDTDVSQNKPQQFDSSPDFASLPDLPVDDFSPFLGQATESISLCQE